MQCSAQLSRWLSSFWRPSCCSPLQFLAGPAGQMIPGSILDYQDPSKAYPCNDAVRHEADAVHSSLFTDHSSCVLRGEEIKAQPHLSQRGHKQSQVRPQRKGQRAQRVCCIPACAPRRQRPHA